MERISKETLKRLPNYLRFLRNLKAQAVECVSSTVISEHFKLNPVQVRKDLANISSVAGKPKTGFLVDNLIADISDFLGYNNTSQAVLVGAGHLGQALLNYNSFNMFGMEIVAAFDCKIYETEFLIAGKPVFRLDKLADLVRRLNIHIGIITVPKEAAQEVCDLMVTAGIRAIWNFAPTRLNVPNNIALKSEDMAASLAVLSNRLSVILRDGIE